jgi:cell wall assembly regulator SMI1
MLSATETDRRNMDSKAWRDRYRREKTLPILDPTWEVGEVWQRITVRELLDALPDGSAVRDDGGQILVRDGDLWLEPGGSDLTPTLPALVIWHPSWIPRETSE